MLIYGLLVFLLVTLVSIALLTWALPNPSQRRMQELVQPARRTDWVTTVVNFAGPLANLSIPDGNWEDSALRLKFLNAGIRSPKAPIFFYAAKTALPLLFAGAGYLMLEVSSQNLESNPHMLVLLLSR